MKKILILNIYQKNKKNREVMEKEKYGNNKV